METFAAVLRISTNRSANCRKPFRNVLSQYALETPNFGMGGVHVFSWGGGRAKELMDRDARRRLGFGAK